MFGFSIVSQISIKSIHPYPPSSKLCSPGINIKAYRKKKRQRKTELLNVKELSRRKTGYKVKSLASSFHLQILKKEISETKSKYPCVLRKVPWDLSWCGARLWYAVLCPPQRQVTVIQNFKATWSRRQQHPQQVSYHARLTWTCGLWREPCIPLAFYKTSRHAQGNLRK